MGFENMPVQTLGPQLSVEALDERVLPRASRCDEDRLAPLGPQPGPHRLGDELGAVVAADVLRRSPPRHQPFQRGEHPAGLGVGTRGQILQCHSS